MIASLLVLIASFTLVVNGDIESFDMVQRSSGTWVEGQALQTLAQGRGYRLSVDGKAGVISLSRGDGKGERLAGFRGEQATIVVGKQILRKPIRVKSGVPYFRAADLGEIAEQIGWRSSMDPDAGVLALVAPRGGGASEEAGVDRTATAATSGSATSEVAAPAGVCEYMDELKRIWDGTEPSLQEKAAFQRLSADLQAMQQGQMDKDLQALEDLKRHLGTFAGKVERRTTGTRDLQAPSAAQGVRRTGMDFLDSVNEVVDTGQWVLRQLGPKDEDDQKDRASWKAIEKRLDQLKAANQAVQSKGSAFNRVVLRVRSSHGCGPP